jgi:hypothetical protein
MSQKLVTIGNGKKPLSLQFMIAVAGRSAAADSQPALSTSQTVAIRYDD